MASRGIIRRLLSTNLRQPMRHMIRNRPSVLSACQPQSTVQHTACPVRYSQIRSLCSQKGAGMVVNIQDDKDFEDLVINNKLPVVVDFHASWCGPCKLLGPRLESLVGARDGKVILAKIDVDEHEELVMKYRINSVPTVMGFHNKEKVDHFIGLKDDDIIETFLDKLIG